MSIAFNGGEMLQMLPETDSTTLEKKVESILVFKDLLEEKKDIILKLSLEQQAKLKQSEPFSLHMIVDPDNGVMKFDIFTDFKDVSDVDDTFNAFQNASEASPTAGGKCMPTGTTEETQRSIIRSRRINLSAKQRLLIKLCLSVL